MIIFLTILKKLTNLCQKISKKNRSLPSSKRSAFLCSANVLLYSVLILGIGTVSLAGTQEGAHEPDRKTEPTNSQEQTRMMIHLLDYLAKDYGGAVGTKGQVLDEGEYAEQIEFAEKIEDILGQHLDLRQDHQLNLDVKNLVQGIKDKTSPEVVASSSRSIQAVLIQKTGLKTYPKQWPDQKLAVAIFKETCSSCHGAEGRGDGPLGQGLDPKPANFRDPETGKLLAPYQAFNTIRLGVPGTGMPAFAQLSDSETWALAFYVVSLKYRVDSAQTLAVTDVESLLPNVQQFVKSAPKTSQAFMEYVAQRSDDSIDKDFNDKLNDPTHREQVLRDIRLMIKTEEIKAQSSLAMTKHKLDESLKALKNGDLPGSRQLSLEAYLEGLEPIEPRLASLDPQMLKQTEQAMMNIRRVLESVTDSTLAENSKQIEDRFAEAHQLLTHWQTIESQGQITPKIAFFATLGIVLREGFEAALLILSLLLITRIDDQKSGESRGMMRRPATFAVHLGWASALAVGLLMWFSSEKVLQISGADREFIEGVTSLFAVLMLIGLGLWIHRRSEIKRWNAYLNEKVYRAIDQKNYWALGSIAFLAVFREAAETVLFLRTLTFDASSEAQLAMGAALAATGCGIIALTWLALKFSIRIPTRKIFAASSWVMLALAVMLTGKGFHALQESGHIPSTELVAFSFDQLEVLGVYATWETLIPQVLVLLGLACWVSFSMAPRKPDLEHVANS